MQRGRVLREKRVAFRKDIKRAIRVPHSKLRYIIDLRPNQYVGKKNGERRERNEKENEIKKSRKSSCDDAI